MYHLRIILLYTFICQIYMSYYVSFFFFHLLPVNIMSSIISSEYTNLWRRLFYTFLSVAAISFENSESGRERSTAGASNSTILPSLITRMRLHVITVCKRWAIVSTVQSANSFCKVFCTAASVSGSTEAVASSRIST